MSEPVIPAAPEAPPVPVPDPPATPPAADPAAPASNPWDSPESAKAEIERLRRENGTDRVNAKAKAAEEARIEQAQIIGKALGLIKDDPIDPGVLAEQAASATASARQAQVQLAVFRTAPAGTDVTRLLDSISFGQKLAAIDPADHVAIAAAVGEAVAADPSLVRTGTGLPAFNPAQGSSGAGAPNLDDQIAAATKAGDWRQAIHLQNQKLAAPSR